MAAAAAGRPLKCALLSFFAYWPGEVVIACPGLELVAFDGAAIGLPEDRNPFDLPLDDRADVALVTAWWHRWLTHQHADRAEDVMRAIERRAGVVVGLDGPSRFALTFPPAAMKRFAVVLKFQGIYRDRALFNYVVGPQYPGGNWSEKVRPAPERYETADLEKLRLSVPCFATALPGVRRRFRARPRAAGTSPAAALKRAGVDLGEAAVDRALALAPTRARTRDVHCLAGLSHVQRIEALERLAGLSGSLGIVATQRAMPQVISGTEHGGSALPPELSRSLVESAQPYWRDSLGRIEFLFDLRRHRVGFAPTGYGELTYRHAEVLRAGAALVSQDLRHVEMMLPLTEGENVRFCRPDLSDLRAVVDELLADPEQRMRIGVAGRKSFSGWARGWATVVRDGVEQHIREAAGAPAASGTG